jgi:hypothetical protein
MLKEKRADAMKSISPKSIVPKRRNGRGEGRSKHRQTNIEPVLRMLAALTDAERTAVKAALDKEAFVQEILRRSENVRQGNGITFTPAQFDTFTALSTLDEKVGYAKKLHVHAKRA